MKCVEIHKGIHHLSKKSWERKGISVMRVEDVSGYEYLANIIG